MIPMKSLNLSEIRTHVLYTVRIGYTVEGGRSGDRSGDANSKGWNSDAGEAWLCTIEQGYKAIYTWPYKRECVHTHLCIDPAE